MKRAGKEQNRLIVIRPICELQGRTDPFAGTTTRHSAGRPRTVTARVPPFVAKPSEQPTRQNEGARNASNPILTNFIRFTLSFLLVQGLDGILQRRAEPRKERREETKHEHKTYDPEYV